MENAQETDDFEIEIIDIPQDEGRNTSKALLFSLIMDFLLLLKIPLPPSSCCTRIMQECQFGSVTFIGEHGTFLCTYPQLAATPSWPRGLGEVGKSILRRGAEETYTAQLA
ncbi:MAG TPA: hypothetical protein VGT44_19270, partial [Ktedonobacteraceae bacterium]|nr:hypothetical protein [Ktedonobacteraceae bacterium]